MKVKVTMTIERTYDVDPEDYDIEADDDGEYNEDEVLEAVQESVQDDPSDFVDEASYRDIKVRVVKA